MILDSALWIDTDDALDRIAAMRVEGAVSAAQAEGMAHFAAHGFLVFDSGFGQADCDAIEHEVNRLWRERPADVAYAYLGPARSMRHADEARERKNSCRIHDAHSHGATLRSLYLDAKIHEWIDLLLGEPSVAIQSLYFQYGSGQTLHRDPVVVPTAAHGHLFAAWIALEDIHPGSGELIYIPGSHRLPYYEFSPGQYQFDGSKMGDAEVTAGTAFDDEQCQLHRLEARHFTATRGQVLLWHAGLRHGGADVTVPGATRRSFVVHFSTLRTYQHRAITIVEPGAFGRERSVVVGTRDVIEQDGHVGFESPMKGFRPRRWGFL